MTPSPEPASALTKGLAVLDLILRDRGETSIVRLTRGLCLPRSTLHRLLGDLLRQGLILRTGRGRYDIGLTLAEAAPGLSVNGQIARAARQPLARLAADCGLTTHLGVYEGDMVTYLVKESPRYPDVQFTRENDQLEAYCSGIGKVLLANLPAALRSAYLAGGPFVALTPHTITNPARLEDCLRAVAAQDYATDDEEIADGLRCLAVPVRDGSGRVVAAVSVSASGRDRVLDENPAIRQLLNACAATIGDALGRRPLSIHARSKDPSRPVDKLA